MGLTGTLVNVLPRYRVAARTLLAVYPQAPVIPRKVQAFVEFLKVWMAAQDLGRGKPRVAAEGRDNSSSRPWPHQHFQSRITVAFVGGVAEASPHDSFCRRSYRPSCRAIDCNPCADHRPLRRRCPVRKNASSHSTSRRSHPARRARSPWSSDRACSAHERTKNLWDDHCGRLARYSRPNTHRATSAHPQMKI